MTKIRMMPQDDKREIAMRAILDLRESGEGREGSDAIDECDNKYELKTSFKKDRGVSTARSVNFRHVAKWREKHWIIAFGNHYKDGFNLTEFYYISPRNMEEWISKVECRLEERKELSDYTTKCLYECATSDVVIKKINTILRWGSKLNDPRLPVAYIKSHGVLLEAPFDKYLRKVLDTSSIRTITKFKEHNLEAFFT